MGQINIITAVVLTIVLSLQISFVFAETKVYVVYLGKKTHEDPESVTQSHHQLLWSLLGSKKAVHDSIVYSYRHGFSGFAAKLTEPQAQQISELPEVVHVTPNTLYELKTTRTWDYLGLSPGNSNSLLQKANMGSPVIVGIIDSGVWPESEMFNDKGYGPIPNRWKGSCESGVFFNASIHCNRKLIGAKYYVDGLVAESGALNTTGIPDYLSPRDISGHGTHVASTVCGSFLPNVSYLGLGGGTVRGGAPGVHIAIYKACWLHIGTCSQADILKAIDEAINDGVDVLSLSLGSKVPLYLETDVNMPAMGLFHAVAKGIHVVAAAGNEGPVAQTITNVPPWILTVAATTLDRSFPTAITLGNNITILGQAIFAGPELDFVGLTYPPSHGCEELFDAKFSNIMKGKVVLCFTTALTSRSGGVAVSAVLSAGGLGLIIARNPTHSLSPVGRFPYVSVDFELGTDILFYIRSTRSPIVKIHASRTLVAQSVATKVATFSSRGPNSVSPAILKPDISAPGVNILAATSPNDSSNDRGFAMMSGTSMATPVVSAVVVLLKSLYPDWSPAAIKSAIVTTAWKTDPSGEPIFADGSSRKLADPFDYGGGLINPEKAERPGLIYDMTIDDYVLYLCAADYDDTSISQVFGKNTVCPNPKPSILDLNLPSITIPNLREEVTLTRTVTNVGPVDSIYKVMIDAPIGINMIVTPDTLEFNSMTKKVSFKVRVSTTHKVNTGYYFGSLTWTDNVHNVVIPVSVRTQILLRYHDEN